ncbi:hypothetical protein [Peribacillus loiseleuriae]|uniref:hypothetical protein n=1 Tax=Peribacillus loiseleuriae TaxID=1679170 RepID=UPI003D080112
MVDHKKENDRLIDLYGQSLSILHKNPDFMSLLFLDDHYGKLVCTIPCELSMYREIKRDVKYHLQVDLKGISKVRGSGKSHTSNHLVVRKVFEVEKCLT